MLTEVIDVIRIPRGLCRAFPALARKCVAGRPRGPAPAVAFEATGGTLTARVMTDDAVLAYTAPADCDDGVLVVPMAAVEAAAGPGGEPVALTVGPDLRGEAKWSDRGAPRSHPFEAILPGRQHRPPDPPDGWHPAPAALLAALHECGRTAAREAGRFALTRVQLRGKSGQVVGTDGRTALLWRGFAFPFADDLLVPALPVFGSRELAGERAVRVGRTATHLAVGAGPWAVFVAIDRTGRYPDVAGVVPRDAPTTVEFDDRDAEELLRRLPGLPGGDADHRPVTLAVEGGVVVRTGDAKGGRAVRARLRRSTATGPGVAAAVDRRVFARALALGCRTGRLTPDRPVVFAGGDTTLVTVALDPVQAVGPKPGRRDTVTDATDTEAHHNTPERSDTVKHETNGHPPGGRHDPPDTADPLAAAEELRAALADALAAAGRLVSALKHQKREKKALASVYAGLKALNLGAGGQP